MAYEPAPPAPVPLAPRGPLLRAEEPARGRFPWASAAQSVTILGAVGGSLGLFVTAASLGPVTLGAFLEKNTIVEPARMALLRGGVLGAFALASLGAALCAALRRPGVEALRRAADLVLPLALAFLLPSLFSWRPWHDAPLAYLVQLAAFAIALEAALRRALAAVPEPLAEWWERTAVASARVRRLGPLALVVAGAVFYSIYFSYYTLLNHRRLGTTGFDLGINVNWAYNALHGHPFRCPVLLGPDGGNFLGGHAIFGMVFWLPFFAIRPGGEILLIYQSSIAGFAAVTLYLFARTQIPRWSAALVAIAYLFYAPLHGPNFYDFHELLPPIFFHFLLYWAIATGRTAWVCLLVPALWSFREDVAVGLAMLGVFLLVGGIRPRMGAAIAGASVVWFYLIKFEIMPRLWHSWFSSIYTDLQYEKEEGFRTVVHTLLTNPAYVVTTLLKEPKLVYFLHIFGPVALLPCRRPALLFLALPGFFFTLLTTGYGPTLSIGFQYAAHWIPYVFAATVLVLRVLGTGDGGAVRRRAAIGAVLVAMASHSYVFGAILQHNSFVGGFSKIEFTMTGEEQDRYRELRRLVARIPKDAVVAATENENPHVAARMTAYTLKDQHGDADWLLVSARGMGTGNTKGNLQAAFARASYGLVDKGLDFYLFQKGHSSPETEAAKAALGL